MLLKALTIAKTTNEEAQDVERRSASSRTATRVPDVAFDAARQGASIGRRISSVAYKLAEIRPLEHNTTHCDIRMDKRNT